MNKDATLGCKVHLPKKSSNSEPEIYRISEFPATLLELQERITQKCSAKLPNKYNIAFEQENLKFKTLATEEDFAEVMKIVKADKSAQNVRFHIIEVFESEDSSLERLEKMLGDMKSYPPEPEKLRFTKIEDIDVTTSIIGPKPTKKEVQENIVQDNLLQKFDIPVSFQNSYEKIELASSEIVGSKPKAEKEEKKEDIEEKKEKEMPDEQTQQKQQQEIEKANDLRVEVNGDLNLNRQNFSNEQTDAINALINQRVAELERQIAAQYEVLYEQKIQRLNQEWIQRFEHLEATFAQIKVANVKQNGAAEERKIEAPFENRGRLNCADCRTSSLPEGYYNCSKCESHYLCNTCFNKKEQSHEFFKVNKVVELSKGIKLINPEDLDAVVTKEPLITIHQGARARYETPLSLKNVGNAPWPENTVLECMSGCHVGEYRYVGDNKQGDEVGMILQFPYPNKPGVYQSIWRLCTAGVEEKPKKYFGPKIKLEVKVEHQEDIESKYSKEVREKAALIQSVINLDKAKTLEFVNRNPQAKIDELINNFYNQA